MAPSQFSALLDVHNEQEDARRKFADYRAGVVAAAIVNANPYRGRDAKTIHPSDFFPHLDPPGPHVQSPREMMGTMRAFAARHNKRLEA